MQRNPIHRLRTAIQLHRSMRFVIWLGLVLTVLVAGLRAQVAAPEYDTIIRNGRIIDGTGNPAIHSDLAIKAGRIAVIGKVTGTAKQELDARGLIVAPGFIDVHT